MQLFLKLLILLGLITAIAACSSTPNSITIGPNQNQCVQSNMYSPSVTPPVIIANNPVNAPYCMSITMQNNNSGINANNIQITSGGLTMSYTVGSTTYSSQMYDPVAAGITISGANQVLGNVEVFDPGNCLTNSGANVITLNAGGSTCTFYLQILSESNPVGIYPTNLTYNYTNGNQNYAISTNVNQRVNLFAGGTTGLFVDNSSSWVAGSSLPVPISIPTAVTSLARDIYGNIYITTSNTVYQFNGVATTQLTTGLTSGILINGITTDLNGSIYIATNQGIFKYSFLESNPAWAPYDDLTIPSNISTTTNVISIKSYENFESTNVIYATTESQAFVCNSQSDLSGFVGCHWALLTNGTPPNKFLQNALAVDLYNNLYTANESSVNTYSSNQWINVPFFNTNTTGTLDTIYWTLYNNTQYLYAGETSAPATESAVYVCNFLTSTCSSLQSQSNNPITGNVYGVAADGANNVYVVGNSINSADFPGVSNVFGAYLTFSGSAWIPIANPSVISGGSLTVAKISSMFTSY